MLASALTVEPHSNAPPATFGLWAVSGAILTPSAASRCSCGACCVFHPRWITVVIGVVLLVANVVVAFGMNEPTPIVSLYFALPPTIVLFVVLGLRTAVARTADSRVGSIAMLGSATKKLLIQFVLSLTTTFFVFALVRSCIYIYIYI